MPIWHQSPKLTPRYFLETPRLFGYPITQIRKKNRPKPNVIKLRNDGFEENTKNVLLFFLWKI